MATVKELKDAIVQAVATLDESDGSRISTSEAIDSSREILADAYGPTLEDDVSEYLREDDADGDGILDRNDLDSDDQ